MCKIFFLKISVFFERFSISLCKNYIRVAIVPRERMCYTHFQSCPSTCPMGALMQILAEASTPVASRLMTTSLSPR